MTLKVKDLQKSREFYNHICGMKVIIQDKDYVGLTDGTFALWLSFPRDPALKSNKFNRNMVGLDHWAFKVNTIEELKRIEKHLKDFNVPMEDNGITDDGFGGTAIFTTDPDGMKVEFHLQA